jgi:hypothetical protein
MRVVLLAILACTLCACSQASNLHRQIVWNGGIGYDVRPTATAASSATYDASAAYSSGHKPERTQITRNLLYRGLTRLKADGYTYALVQGPSDGKVTSTTYQYGRVISSADYPAFQYKLTGYKADGSRPPMALDIDKALAQLKPQVSNF